MAACAETIVIGTIAESDAGLFVFFKNLATGRITRISTTSNGDGLVSVDVSDMVLIPNQSYEIWVTLNSDGMDCRQAITPVDCTGTPTDETYTCFNVTFYNVHDKDLMMIYYSTQIITV